METPETYRDRDNTFWIVFYKNNVILTPAEMAVITKIEIKHKGVYYNSISSPTGFVRDDANGKVKVKPYELDLAVSRDDIEVLIYDAGDHTHGLFWDVFNLLVRSDVLLPTTLSPTSLAPTTVP